MSEARQQAQDDFERIAAIVKGSAEVAEILHRIESAHGSRAIADLLLNAAVCAYADAIGMEHAPGWLRVAAESIEGNLDDKACGQTVN